MPTASSTRHEGRFRGVSGDDRGLLVRARPREPPAAGGVADATKKAAVAVAYAENSVVLRAGRPGFRSRGHRDRSLEAGARSFTAGTAEVQPSGWPHA
jgi:hypothetical protein